MKHPTQDQLLNAAIMLDGAHPAVAAWLVRMAEQQAAEPVVGWVLLRKDADGFEPIMFYGGKEKPEGEFKDRFTLRPIRFADATQQPLTEATVDSLYQHMAADERTKTFTAQNWFQAGIAMAEAAYTGSKP